MSGILKNKAQQNKALAPILLPIWKALAIRQAYKEFCAVYCTDRLRLVNSAFIFFFFFVVVALGGKAPLTEMSLLGHITFYFM